MDVETASPLSAGQTVVDIWRQSSRPANCTVAMVSARQVWRSLLMPAHARAHWECDGS